MKILALLLLTSPVFAADTAPAAAPAAAPKAEAPKAEVKADVKKEAKKEALPAAMSEEGKTLYSLGYLVGMKTLMPFSLSAAELKTVQAGLNDAVLNKKSQYELQTYGPKIEDLAKGRAAKASEARKAGDKKAVDAAAKEAGAVKLSNGGIYKELKAGKGASPTADDTVKCHYEGKLVDGTVFDSSYKRGEPTDFPLKGVIPCWTVGIQKLKVGGKARLTCPSDVAYGDGGRPPMIPGGATLIFDVELIEIVKK